MITIKFIPNFAKLEGRESWDKPYENGKTVEDYINGIDKEFGSDTRIILSGKDIKDFSIVPDDGDEIIITGKIADPLTISVVFWAIVAAAVEFIITALPFIILSAIFAFVSRGKKPNSNLGGTGMDEGSPTYGWNGAQATQEVGIPIGVVYGEHRVAGNIINQYIWTDGDKNYLNMLIALGEGEIESISNIKINDNPIANFDAVEQHTRMGTNAQSMISYFNDLHNVYSVGATLMKDNAYVYTTVNSDVEVFELKFVLPSGLFYQNPSNGSINSWSVTYKVEYKLHADPTYIDLGDTTISTKSRTTLRRIFRKDGLAAGQYDIRITKISDDGDFNHTGDLQLSEVDEIQTDDLSYPNTALLGLKLLATDQLSGAVPNVTSLIKGKLVRVPDIRNAGVAVNWDDYYWDNSAEEWKLLADDTGLSWDGTTYVNAYCANPVWCMRDLILSTRYGLGQFINIANIDDAQLLEMAKYCEEKVADGEDGFEKRFRMDVVIDTNTKAIDAFLQLCAVFNAMPLYSGGALGFVIDRPQTPTQLFGMGNIIKDSFTQSWKSVKEVPNVIEIQFCDKDKGYKMETIIYADEDALSLGDPVRKQQIRLFTTKTSYAIRAARYAIKVSKYINVSVSFRTGIDAVACQAGDVISLSHDVPQWGFSGRVKSGSTTTLVKLDREVTIVGGTTYKIRVKMADDTIEEKTVSSGAGTYSEVTVSQAFSTAPAEYDVYAFGESTKVKKDFRILSIKKDGKSEVEIVAVEYDVNAFDDSDVIIPGNNYTDPPIAVPPVENLALTEGIVVAQDGTINHSIEVWFQIPDTSGLALEDRYRGANVYYSDNDGASWFFVGYTEGSSLVILENLNVGTTYKVCVASVSYNGHEMPKADSAQASITMTGNASEPNDVVNFVYTFLNEIVFTWDDCPNPDLEGYEIRTENANWGTQNAHMIYNGLSNTFTIVSPVSRSPGTYYIRAYNSSGNYSSASVLVAPTNTVPGIPTISATQWFGFAKIEWSDVADTDLKYYEIYKSPTNVWGGEEILEAKVPGTAGNVQGNAPVDAKADAVDSTSITDSDIAGHGADYFVGDVIVQTSGTYKDQEAIISAYNDLTGQVSVASWPSGTPDVDDEFVMKDRAYYKVRAVDMYGPGSFSSAVTINFTPLTEAEMGDAVISARKLIAGELITLSAQIKDLVVTNAKILNLDGEKITAQSITLSKLAGDAIPSKTYYQDDEPTAGVNEGDYWIDTDDDNKLYIYDSGSWQVVSESGGGGGITVFRQDAIPTSTAVGDLWIDTDDGDKMYRATNIGDDEIVAGEWELIDAASATGWTHGLDITKIDGGQIYTDSVTADQINVNQLDALAVNTGSLTVDEIVQVGDNKVVIDGVNKVIKVYDASSNLRVELGLLS